jgi:hypothetical protein
MKHVSTMTTSNKDFHTTFL